MNSITTLGIFIFNEVEVLDMAGPFEVFSLARKNNVKLCQVITIAEKQELITARNGLQLLPNKTFADNPKLDILIIPGGYGAEEIEIKNKKAIEWIKSQKSKVKIMVSVCTGALLLAEAGLLDNKRATTHWMDIDRLEKDYPKVKAIRGTKFVDEGDILTSGGISAGINLSFYLLKRLFDSEVAKETARRMEYDIVI